MMDDGSHAENKEAAFDRAVSSIAIRPVNHESTIDLRKIRLPESRLETDFDPRKHRNPKSPLPLWVAYWNLIRIGFGAGVLGVPLAISQAGIMLGSMMSVFCILLLVHTHIMLIECLNDVSKQLEIPYITYRYGFRIAMLHGPPICQCLGKCGQTLIGIFMFLSQLGICAVFVTFTSDSLRDMMDWSDNTPALIALLFPYLLLIFFMTNLKIVSYVNIIGNVLNVIGFGLVFYHIFQNPRRNVNLYTSDALPLLFAFGLFLFNYSVIGVVIAMDRGLKNPEMLVKRHGVIIVGLLISCVVATVFGAFGYWSFGTMEENILRSLPFDTYTTMAASALYLLSIAFTYPLQCFPAIGLIIDFLKQHDINHEPSAATLKTCEYVGRPIFVLTSFLVAYLVPFQGPVVAFVGCLCTSLLALVFPALMEICIMYPGPFGKYHFYLIKDLLIITLGLCVWIFGVILNSRLIFIRIMSTGRHSDNDYL